MVQFEWITEHCQNFAQCESASEHSANLTRGRKVSQEADQQDQQDATHSDQHGIGTLRRDIQQIPRKLAILLRDRHIPPVRISCIAEIPIVHCLALHFVTFLWPSVRIAFFHYVRSSQNVLTAAIASIAISNGIVANCRKFVFQS